MMDSCRGKGNDSPSTAYQVAQNHLDSLTSSHNDAHLRVAGSEAHSRFQIEINHALNRVAAAELRDIAHSCAVCNPDAYPETTHEACSITAAKAFIDDTKDKLMRMENVMARIEARNDVIAKLEQHLNTYNHIARSLNIVQPTNGTSYSYRIDPDHGVSLVIEASESNNSQPETRPPTPDLLDLSIIPSVFSPVLTPHTSHPSLPSSSPSLSSSLLLNPSNSGTPVQPTQENLTTTTITTPNTKPQPSPSPSPNLQTYAKIQGRSDAPQKQARRSNRYNNTPLIFHHGIQYTPPPPTTTAEVTSASRMLIFSNLPLETTSASLLAHVRGGPVLRVTAASATTALLWFVNGRDAHAYITHLAATNSAESTDTKSTSTTSSTGTQALTIDGKTVCVSLASTPSYPLRESLLRDIQRRGATRCLAFPRYDAAFGRFLGRILEGSGLEKFVDDAFLERCSSDRDNYGVAYGRDGNGYGYVYGAGGQRRRQRVPASEPWLEPLWLVEEDDEDENDDRQALETSSSAAAAPAPVVPLVLHVSFRDIIHAQNMFRRARAVAPRCGVYYAPDPCAGPLWELES